MITQGITMVGEKTGYYAQKDAENISAGLNFLVTGLSGLPKSSARKIIKLDLSLPKTFNALKTVTNANKGTALANRIPEVVRSTSSIASRSSGLPLFNDQQQMLRFGAATALGVAAIFADKAVKETVQQFKWYKGQLGSKYIFVQEEPISSTSELPIYTVEPLTTTFPINENKVTILAGPVIEIKKPIIFSGGLDDKDKQFLDSLTVMESKKHNKAIEEKIIERIKEIQLPVDEGKVRFIPPKNYYPSKKLEKKENSKLYGYEDADGNFWVKGPVRKHGSSLDRKEGETFEWDVILGNAWKAKFKDVAKNGRNGKYINVSSKGEITH